MSNQIKKELGQFYTTNYKYILQNLKIQDGVKNVIEPFVGNGDLLEFVKNIDSNKSKYNLECYDLDPKIKNCVTRDTLINPPDYLDKFIITNPPYLARNKSKNKTIFDKYNVNDLYKAFIITLLKGNPSGGIIIIPLNFWSSIRKNDIELRKTFLQQYQVINLNIFETPVFDDTDYTVCAFSFTRKVDKNNSINIILYPDLNKIKFIPSSKNNYTVGGELYSLQQSDNYVIDRITSKNMNSEGSTNILVKCIDDHKPIGLEFNTTKYIDKTSNQSARSYATLRIVPELSDDKQKILISMFNKFLNENRKKYYSIFLTNYREGKRKRISFSLVYKIVNYLLSTQP